MLKNFSYYACIMPNSFIYLLYSKLCWHNWLFPSMYVSMYVCMHACMYIRTYVCMYACMYTVCVYVHTYVCMYVCMYVCTLYVGMYIHMYVCMHVCIIYIVTWQRGVWQIYTHNPEGVLCPRESAYISAKPWACNCYKIYVTLS